ncbi:hypothetical protein DFH07DRAFT_789834 [Mycena maculata]|uniref:Uncharacterized protein n=1 Tax=Mycena maculata TaxID=230809 RepID=A0AAD7KG79_9AGAR|nr:hypothetical protein DFH07DRAFT_789834 [Mycena maculata]
MAAQAQFTLDHIYEALRVTLWPVDGGPVKSVRGEPPALRDRIETLTPDDGWLTTRSKKSDSDAVDVDDSDGEGEDPNDGEDACEGPARIHYINLEDHPALAIDELGREVDQHHNKATFAVRYEYGLFMEHAMSRVSDPPDDSYRARFFVAGKSFGCYYFLFSQSTKSNPRQSMLSESAGSSSTRMTATGCPLRSSITPEVWRRDVVHEDVVVERNCSHNVLDTCGPVARSLWGGVPIPSPQTTDAAIKNALSGNIFAFTPTDAVHRVFLIQPLVVIDEESGRAYFQRTDYSAEFISAQMAHRILDLAQDHLERVQGQLAAALNISTTRSVAGKFVEGMMHRALAHGMQLPAVFGAGTVAGTLELIGKAGSFVCVTDTTDRFAKERPLYLRPESLSFAAVDAILVMHENLGFIQASLSLGDSHRRDFGVMLRIMSRLPRGAQVDVSSLGEVIYCLVGTAPERVQKLVVEASRTLAELKTFDAQKLSKELRMRHIKIAHTRLSTFRVVGYTFDHKQGFMEVR